MESASNPTSDASSPPIQVGDRKTSRARSIWLLVFTVVWGLWWGGLTFYASFVVPIGTEIIGGTEQGFITQRVTEVLNGLALALSVVWLAEYVYTRKKLLAIAWIVFFLATLGLLFVHRLLSTELRFETREVPESFYQLHAIYLWFTTTQWLAGLSLPIIRLFSDR
jgi:hypothetical protein